MFCAAVLTWRLPLRSCWGPMIYRHVFVSKLGGKGPKDLEIHVVDAFLAAFGTERREVARR